VALQRLKHGRDLLRGLISQLAFLDGWRAFYSRDVAAKSAALDGIAENEPQQSVRIEQSWQDTLRIMGW